MGSIGLFGLGLGIGVGIIVTGAAYGIGALARAALESTGRQPEAGGEIRLQMIIAAALIEGFTFAAIGAIFYGLVVMSGLGGAAPDSQGDTGHARLHDSPQPSVTATQNGSVG